MKQHMSHRSGETDIQLADLLGRLGKEIARSAVACTELESSISTLLERGHHPDLGAEIHMLQDVDRLHQTLMDAASILEVCGAGAADMMVSASQIGAAIRLESLRDRLFLGLRGSPHTLAPGEKPNDDDVTWF